MTSKRQLLRVQRSWATSRGLQPDTRGYLRELGANLLQPLSAAALAAFEEGGAAELNDRPAAPAKMKALHSSAVLAVNVFDHWTLRDGAALLQALEIDGALATPPRFEARLPTGLPGQPPNLDVLLELASGAIIGIESKFTEWLTPKRRNREPFAAKYFARGADLWTRHALPRCQALVAEVMSGAQRYRCLDAPQLLKHALGLAAQHRGRFALYYLYYDSPSPASVVHRSELTRFEERVGGELRFRAVTYQEVYRRMSELRTVDAGYLAYLGARYFTAGAADA
jgi:hypothetical protein